MANETARIYETSGAAARDVYALRFSSNGAEQLGLPRHLPEEVPVQRKQTRVKVKTAVAPFTMFGIIAAACMMVLVIFGYVQLFEATSRVGKLESQLNQLTQTQIMLQSRYDGSIDLQQVEVRAEALGMTLPSAEQTVYVNLSGSDRAEIYQQEKSNFVGDVVGAMEQSVSSLIEYLRPSAA
ncbi:MAG: hypothetical protein IIY04_06445 [Oscillospiraceae bacterium]|nr:hypothetical protein [Oscillospiraceae bacterium]